MTKETKTTLAVLVMAGVLAALLYFDMRPKKSAVKAAVAANTLGPATTSHFLAPASAKINYTSVEQLAQIKGGTVGESIGSRIQAATLAMGSQGQWTPANSLPI